MLHGNAGGVACVLRGWKCQAMRRAAFAESLQVCREGLFDRSSDCPLSHSALVQVPLLHSDSQVGLLRCAAVPL